MTRTEAIGLLSGLMFKGKLKEALDMAIKALEQEPIIKESEEYITKQALEDTLMTAYKHQLSDHDAKLFVEFMSFVDDLPSVIPQEPKKGHWIFHSGAVYDEYICSNCNKRHADYATNYCPNCGADMREVQE